MIRWTQNSRLSGLFLGICLLLTGLVPCAVKAEEQGKQGAVAAAEPESVTQSGREIPVARAVDVVVVGGSTGAAAAAVRAAKAGASVFLAAPRPYLGDDMTATLRLWLEPGEETNLPPLAAKIFRAAEDGSRPSPVRPLHVKKTLDEALLDAGVGFLYGCYATDVLRDGRGNLCGIVMANRAGRQAVIARTIIDATERATVARMAGVEFRPYPGGMHTFKRTVIGGEVRQGPNVTARTIEPAFVSEAKPPKKGENPKERKLHKIIEYTVLLPMPDASYASFAAADQQARTLTYHPNQLFTSDVLFEIPPDTMRGETAAGGAWQGADKLPLSVFRPKGVPRLYVLGGCIDIPREQAAKLLRPPELMRAGEWVGEAAAREAKSLAKPEGAHVPGGRPARVAAEGDVKEFLEGVRPLRESPAVPQEAGGLPVLGRYDVVVIGGGTGGAPAGIAAARQGVRTLVVEYLAGLGGVSTLGGISHYWYGNRVGFTATIPAKGKQKDHWDVEQRMEWYRQELLKAGADIWFRGMGCGALVHDGVVRGAVVATPQGRGVVLAKVVIDTTGNADIAAAAGAECLYVDDNELAMQGTGLPQRELDVNNQNHDFTMTDETDMVDVWHLFVYAKSKYPDAFDQGQLVDTRERRRIVGEHTLTIVDQVNGRRYPDTVVRASGGNFDSHGYTVAPYLLALRGDPRFFGKNVDIPYRCMLPKGLKGILVASLGLSAHRDAVPFIRMQPDIQNGGYAAGVAAAMAARANAHPGDIDVRALQKHLVEIGNLPREVLTQGDSYPIPPERIADAVEDLGKKPRDLWRQLGPIFARPDAALPLLRQAYSAPEGGRKGLVAFVLAMLGDGTGVGTLMAEVRATPKWDRGWNYSGGRYTLSALDTKIVALGRTGRKEALPPILEKVALLTARDAFSHHRAVALALEAIGDPEAARPLFDLLQKPGMMGHVHSSVEIARKRAVGDRGRWPGGTRRDSLRELALARALYRCGDHQGLGEKLLRAYTSDLRGHFARHAAAVLESGHVTHKEGSQ